MQGGELPVPVADQEARGAALVFEIHDEVLDGLGDPRGGRVRGRAEDPDPATCVLDDRQDIQAGALVRWVDFRRR
jgi:hypothetical protein